MAWTRCDKALVNVLTALAVLLLLWQLAFVHAKLDGALFSWGVALLPLYMLLVRPLVQMGAAAGDLPACRGDDPLRRRRWRSALSSVCARCCVTTATSPPRSAACCVMALCGVSLLRVAPRTADLRAQAFAALLGVELLLVVSFFVMLTVRLDAQARRPLWLAACPSRWAYQ